MHLLETGAAMHRRPRGRIVPAVVFGVLGLNAWAQVALVLLGRTSRPPALVALQALIGAAAAAAVWGSWTGARWAPGAALAWGLVSAGMLVALGPLLALPADVRPGLWTGAAWVLAGALGAAWYLRRMVRAASRTTPPRTG
jgi:hypothetical protein